MPTKKVQKTEERVDLHKGGTTRAKGQMREGLLHGYWEWFRKDGTIMRSGFFDQGKQTGEWKTYAKDGKVAKVTHFK